ncbi:MAG: hypothetical protein GF398_02280 [Chitinivibrionales bacterium]|nr:hypothetical protein [Chitinivibrionales bacterium]
MRYITFGAVALMLASAFIACESQQQASADTTMESRIDSVSYCLGQDIGNSLKQFGSHIDLHIFLQGVKDNLEEQDPRIARDDQAALMQAFLAQQRQEQQAQSKIEGAKAEKEGASFLEENKAKEDIMTTESGLQYKVIKKGEGPKPALEDKVTVHYKGALLSGKEFDSSYKRNEPAQLSVGRVIPGWQEGLQLMSPGAKYQFFIPPELAYGERGAGQQIPPNSTLIFEVELISIDS